MTENIASQKAKDAIKRKIIGSTQNRTRQTHCRATLIHLTKVNIKEKDTINGRAIGKINGTLSNYAQSQQQSF